MNKIIPLHIYPFDVMVSIDETDSKLKKKLKSYGISGLGRDSSWKYPNSTATGRTIMFPSNQTLIRLRSVPKTPFEFGVLAHEIFHAVTFIMHKIGMKLKIMQSDEAYAYLIGYLTKEIMIILNNLK